MPNSLNLLNLLTPRPAVPAVSAPPNWLEQQAAADAGHFDERLNPASSGIWQQFFGHLAGDTAAELGQRSQQVARAVNAHGITYNVYADSNGPRRPWALDTMPLLLPAAEWAQIEAGVMQRTTLLNHMMADIYGPQTLLREGLIPSALVHGHSGYLRPLRGVKPLGGTWLHVCAFDLARSPQGNWQLVGQRTQAPSGLGYLLENRQIVSAQFPDAYREMNVRRLADSYRSFLAGLLSLCPQLEAGEAPRVALLTPGPYNETHFEHAYMARHMGLNLVEGSDLVVRGNRLYMRTLDGLERIHVLLKRLDDEYLDPLELRTDSALGIAGLVQVLRSGQVVLANMPGTGWLESPALLGFLPAIAQKILGQELLLPALDTWWCGEAAAMANALPQLNELVIKPTQNAGHGSVIARKLSRRALDEWTGRIVRNGANTTLQRWMPLAQNPSFQAATAGNAASLQPRSYMLRVFALCDGANVQTNGNPASPCWRVLPGGLARIAGAAQADVVSMQFGGSSADVWVLGPKPSTPTQVMNMSMSSGGGAGADAAMSMRMGSDGLSMNGDMDGDMSAGLTTSAAPVLLQAASHSISSRAAENLFWFGRYTERCEFTARLARVALQALNAEDAPSEALCDWLERCCKRTGVLPFDAFSPGDSPLAFERSLIDGLAGEDTYSVAFNLQALRAAADGVRERMSAEQWQLIDRAHAKFSKALDGHTPANQALAALDELVEDLAAMTGAQLDRMARDNGWRCLSIGRQLERLAQHSAALQVAIEKSTNLSDDLFDALLALFDSTIVYRARYPMRRDDRSLKLLLVHDRDNPRSLAWVCSQLTGRLSRLAQLGPAEKSALAQAVPDPNGFDLGTRTVLSAQLRHLAEHMLTLSDDLSARYFRHLAKR